jgi:hypothetical protein
MICDLFVTALNAAGVQLPQNLVLDGRDIFPLLSTGARTPHQAIFSFHAGQIRTVRSGRWKLHVADPDAGGLERRVFKPEDPWKDPRGPDGVTILAPIEGQAHPGQYPGLRGGDSFQGIALFDLTADPSEQHNVAGKHPNVVEQLRQYYLAMKPNVKILQ